jgi:hypothetical protein
MDAPPVVSPDVLTSLSSEVVALIQWQARQIHVLTARCAELTTRCDQLTARVAELEAKLAHCKCGGKTPTNSSTPPSAKHPHAKPASAKPKSKRSRGGQPGHIDESPTKEGQAKARVWTFVAATFTFFACRLTRAGEVAKDLLGSGFDGIIPCDRAKMYWTFGRLQWCWAHLKRDFQALIDSPATPKNASATT